MKQASRALSQGKTMILADVPESKRSHAQELLDKVGVGMDEFQIMFDEKNRDGVAPKQKELLQYLGRCVLKIYTALVKCLLIYK